MIFFLFQTKISIIKILRRDLMFYNFHGEFYSIPFATFNLKVIDTNNSCKIKFLVVTCYCHRFECISHISLSISQCLLHYPLHLI